MKLDRLRRLTDLFVVGRAVPLRDGTYLWVQAINAYQRDECIHDAQMARSRLVMALQQDGTEHLKVEARFRELGRDRHIAELAEEKAREKIGTFLEEMRADPEWKERMEILMRTNPTDTAAPLSAEEVTLLSTINEAVISELQKRESDERDFLTRTMERQSDAELIEDWAERWIDRRGSQLAQAEFSLTEIWYATRLCEAVPRPDSDELDHSACRGHSELLFETRQEVREAPAALVSLITDALAELNVTGLDPKGSGSPASSSDSSPTPSEAEESTPSTSMATQAPAPGT